MTTAVEQIGELAPKESPKDEADDALETIRGLVCGIRELLGNIGYEFDGEFEAILTQERRLRAYISGLRAR